MLSLWSFAHRLCDSLGTAAAILFTLELDSALYFRSRSQWRRDLRLRSSAARLLRLWVRIPPEHGCLSVVNVVCCQVEVSAKD
jgi:hypothetical protein